MLPTKCAGCSAWRHSYSSVTRALRVRPLATRARFRYPTAPVAPLTYTCISHPVLRRALHNITGHCPAGHVSSASPLVPPAFQLPSALHAGLVGSTRMVSAW